MTTSIQRGCGGTAAGGALLLPSPREGLPLLSVQDGCGTAGSSHVHYLQPSHMVRETAPPTPPSLAVLPSHMVRETAPPTPPSLAVLSLQVRAPSRKNSVVGTRGPERKGGTEAHRRPGAGSSARQQAGAGARGAVSPCSPAPTRPYFPKLPRGDTRPGYMRRAEKPMCAF